jgi:hypothetical protein
MAVGEPAYMYSFGMSDRALILVEFELKLGRSLDLVIGNKPFIENYRWMPEAGTRITVFHKDTGDLVARSTAEPFFAFHHVNAFERGDELIMDLPHRRMFRNLSIGDVWSMEIPVTVKVCPVGGMAISRPLCVPVAVQRLVAFRDLLLNGDTHSRKRSPPHIYHLPNAVATLIGLAHDQIASHDLRSHRVVQRVQIALGHVLRGIAALAACSLEPPAPWLAASAAIRNEAQPVAPSRPAKPARS